MPSTLAKEFIKRKLEECKEPVRKGKAKGEAVGLSRRKYTAVLLMAIYALSTKEVETIIGAKRSLISKWRTETEFKGKIHEINSLLCDQIETVIRDELIKGNFSDIQHYSDILKNKIIMMCDNAAVTGDGNFIVRAWPLLRELVYAKKI
jgi:hypothetical protein